MNPRERGQKLVDSLTSGKDDEALKYLKDKVDFSIVSRGDNAIHLAARRGQTDVIRKMKAVGADLQQKNVHGNVALHYAAKGGHLELAKYLKGCGVELNMENMEGETPLQEAVKTQTMDVIETLIHLGLDPNHKNSKTGETPLHTALRFGAQEAMEGLLVKGARTGIKNNDGKKAEDVAKNAAIRESLRMYTTMLIAMNAGYIKAKGMKITQKSVKEPLTIDRIGLVIESIDIPKEFPTGFYCRREKAENSVITLKRVSGESVFSDVFHIRIFEVNRDCRAKLALPLYRLPSDKEEMVVRFFNSAQEDVVMKCWEKKNKVPYCFLDIVLVPETTCVCVVYIRQKKEDNKISKDKTTITSEIEKNFSLEVPAGSFEDEAVLSLTVYETNPNDYEEPEDEISLSASTNSEENAPTNTECTETPKHGDAKMKALEKSQINVKNGDSKSNKDVKQPVNSSLLTDVYQINISGQQPKKGIKVKIPFCDNVDANDEVVIIRADENSLHQEDDEKALEVLPVKPEVVGMNLIFEVSHFSIYVASWKKKTAAKEEMREIRRQISSSRMRQKPAAFFAVVKQVEGRKHVLVVECVVATRSIEHRRKWLENDGYEEQNPAETGAILMTPGDTFCINVEGNASLEDKADAIERKIQFSLCRSSWQPYHVMLHENIHEQERAYAYVIISKKNETGLEEIVRLRIQLTPPPLTKEEALAQRINQFSKPDETVSYVKEGKFIQPINSVFEPKFWNERRFPQVTQKNLSKPSNPEGHKTAKKSSNEAKPTKQKSTSHRRQSERN